MSLLKYSIQPFLGSDNIQIGMTSTEIQFAMGVQPVRILKSQFDTELTDYYDEIIVYYDSSNICYMIDFTEPGEVLYNGTSIIGKPMKEIFDIFNRLDNNLQFDIINGFVSLKYDIAVYSETMNSPAESVSVAKKGYFSEVLKKNFAFSYDT